MYFHRMTRIRKALFIKLIFEIINSIYNVKSESKSEFANAIRYHLNDVYIVSINIR